jgi:hypothetical protein
MLSQDTTTPTKPLLIKDQVRTVDQEREMIKKVVTQDLNQTLDQRVNLNQAMKDNKMLLKVDNNKPQLKMVDNNNKDKTAAHQALTLRVVTMPKSKLVTISLPEILEEDLSTTNTEELSQLDSQQTVTINS